MTETPDLYAGLGVPHDADAAAIHAAYRQTAKTEHPDGGGSGERFALIKLARDCLTDAGRRAQYDKTGDPGAARIDDGRGALISLLAQALDAVIAKCGERGQKLTELDVPLMMRAWFDFQRGSIKKQRAEFEVLAKRDEELTGRWIEGDDDIMAAIVRSRLDAYHHNIKTCDVKFAQIDAALEILKEIGFKKDDPPPPVPQYARLVDPEIAAAYEQNSWSG